MTATPVNPAHGPDPTVRKSGPAAPARPHQGETPAETYARHTRNATALIAVIVTVVTVLTAIGVAVTLHDLSQLNTTVSGGGGCIPGVTC